MWDMGCGIWDMGYEGRRVRGDAGEERLEMEMEMKMRKGKVKVKGSVG